MTRLNTEIENGETVASVAFQRIFVTGVLKVKSNLKLILRFQTYNLKDLSGVLKAISITLKTLSHVGSIHLQCKRLTVSSVHSTKANLNLINALFQDGNDLIIRTFREKVV